MRSARLVRAVIGAMALCLVPRLAVAGPATEWVKATVGEVKRALGDQASGEGLSPEKLLEISRLIEDRFDFSEMARLALGHHWQQRSPEERREFVDLFRKLLERSHIMKMTAKAKAMHRFVAERVEGDRAIVRAVVVGEDNEVPIDYALVRRKDTWKIYDLGVDGMRLSEIYRSQFNRVISSTSYGELVRRMQIKLQEVAFEGEVQR